jgi:ATP-dependent Zn protease
MIGRWGMSETLGPVTLLPSDGPRFGVARVSPQVAYQKPGQRQAP